MRSAFTHIAAALTALALPCGAALAEQPLTAVDRDPMAGAAVATDDAEATQVAWTVLRDGGTATDAAIAAAFMLTVARPEAAGVAGAGAALRYDAEGRHIIAYVGREISAAVTDPAWLPLHGQTWQKPLDGGRSVGAPTLMQMFGRMHAAAGALPWSRLVAPAAAATRAGRPLSEPTARALANINLPSFGGGDVIFGGSGDNAPKAGRIIRNAALGEVFDAIGRDGADVLAGGVMGEVMVRRVNQAGRHPAAITLEEISKAKPIVAPPVCVALATAALCSTPAPSIGPAVAETAGLIQRALPPKPSARDWANVLAQAHRLAMADARLYLGDPAVHPDRMRELLTSAALDRRARFIHLDRNPGLPGGLRLPGVGRSWIAALPRRRTVPTVSIVVVDGRGDAVALSLTLSGPFGSGLAARGVVLNGAGAAFDPAPDRPGLTSANAIGPGRRPRLDVAPIMALDGDRRLLFAAASRGGENAPAYLAKAAMAHLLLGASGAAAIAAPNIASSERKTQLERLTTAERLKEPLTEIDHRPEVLPLESGLLFIERDATGYNPSADPRGRGASKRKRPKTAPLLDSSKRGS